MPNLCSLEFQFEILIHQTKESNKIKGTFFKICYISLFSMLIFLILIFKALLLAVEVQNIK